MMAADDPAKIEVLLKRGALMIAALCIGNTKSLELLLKAGADLSLKHKVRFDAHALAHAVMTNDESTVQFLLSRVLNPIVRCVCSAARHSSCSTWPLASEIPGDPPSGQGWHQSRLP